MGELYIDRSLSKAQMGFQTSFIPVSDPQKALLWNVGM